MSKPKHFRKLTDQMTCAACEHTKGKWKEDIEAGKSIRRYRITCTLHQFLLPMPASGVGMVGTLDEFVCNDCTPYPKRGL